MAVNLSSFYQSHAARNHRAVIFWFPENCRHTGDIAQQLQQLNALHAHQIGNFRNYLGTEQSILYYDARSYWNCDAFVGLSGTLVGQGLLIIALDSKAMQRPSLQHWLSAFSSEVIFHCHHGEELVMFLRQWTFNLSTLSFTTPFIANKEQQQVLHSLAQLNGHQSLVLYAPRGRGKTATIAYWVSQPHIFSRRFVCAPSKQQAAIYLHADDMIFIPADQLANENFTPQDLLIIDEAATLPIVAQNAALNFPGTLVLATTTEGYEYAGRGFIIRFIKELQQAFQAIHTHELQQPMRWARHDPLEQANSIAFSLYPNEAVSTSLSSPAKNTQKLPSIETKKLTYSHGHCRDYSSEERFIIFRLLVEAHYQTSPNDIQRLLDDPNQSLIVQWLSSDHHKVVMSTVWLSAEGPLSTELIEQITQGKRRPPGNLLPQAYAYYGKMPALAALAHARVVRIAVATPYQGRGVGSALLAHVYNWAQQKGFDALGTSFGVNSALLRFWQKNHWQPIRLGHKPDPASRYPSAIYARPISNASKKPLDTLSSFLITELRYRVNTGHISPTLAAQITAAANHDEYQSGILKQRWQQLGFAFINHELNFLDYQPWLAAALSLGWLPLTTSTTTIGLLQQAMKDSGDLVQFALHFRFSGKKEALRVLRTVCAELHQ